MGGGERKPRGVPGLWLGLGALMAGLLASACAEGDEALAITRLEELDAEAMTAMCAPGGFPPDGEERRRFRVGEQLELRICEVEDDDDDECDGVEGGVFVLYARGAVRCLEASGVTSESCVVESGRVRIRAVDAGEGTLSLRRADGVGAAEAEATVTVHPFLVRWSTRLDPVANQVRVELETSLAPRGTIVVEGSGLDDDGVRLSLGEPAVMDGDAMTGSGRSVTAFAVRRGALPRRVTVRWEESTTVCSGLTVEDPLVPRDAGADAGEAGVDAGEAGVDDAGGTFASVRSVRTRRPDAGGEISGSGILTLRTSEALVGVTPTLVALTPGTTVTLEGAPTDLRGEVPFRFTARELPFVMGVRLPSSGYSAEVEVQE